MRLPCLYLVDCGGAFLPEQDRVFPDKGHFGNSFHRQCRMSQAGLPQLSAVFGGCTAGGAYIPALSDEVVMVRGRYISNHSEARLEAALGDIGITVLPQFTAAHALAEGRLREVLPQWRYTGSYQGAAWLLWRQNLHLPPKLRVLIDYLSETLAPR